MRIPIKIAGIGRYLPEQIIPNRVLENMCNLPEGWIEKFNGVKERRWIQTETASFMAAEAAREALTDANLTLHDIDLIINASGTAEQAIPDGAPLLQRQLGLEYSGIPAFSVHATCLSFIAALKVGAALLETGMHNTILISTSEITSCAVNIHEPESASLLGDGAAAVVITRTPAGESAHFEAIRMETYSEGAYLTAVMGGGTRLHPNRDGATHEENFFSMDGQQILRRARKYSPNFLEQLRPGLSKGLGDISLVIPHQPSLMGLRMLRFFGWGDDQIMITLDWLGNCVAASIPITLYEAVQQGRLKRGDKALLVGSGAGVSFGGLIFTY